MTWASFDEAPAGQYHAPLLQHDMLQPVSARVLFEVVKEWQDASSLISSN
jgi:hypothetical protein